MFARLLIICFFPADSLLTTVKASEMIFEFARDLIATGESMELKQRRLNAAGTAWSIATLLKYDRRKALERTGQRTPVCITPIYSAKTWNT